MLLVLTVWHCITSLAQQEGLHHGLELLHADLSILVLIEKGYQSRVVFLVQLLSQVRLKLEGRQLATAI